MGRPRPQARETATRRPRLRPAQLPRRGTTSHPAHCSAFREWRVRPGRSRPPRSIRRTFPRDPSGGVASPPLGEADSSRSAARARPRPELARAAPRAHLSKRPRPRPRPGHSFWTSALLPVPGSGGSPASGRGWGRGQSGRAGAASGSEPRGRSRRSALVWERCGLPLPTEVGRGARRRRPGAGRGGLCGSSPRGDVGLARGRAACRGGNQPAAPPGKGASRRLLALPLARNFGVGQVRNASRDPGAKAVCGRGGARAFPAAAGGVKPMCVFPVIRGDAGPPLLPG